LRQIDSPDDELKLPARRIRYIGLTFSADAQKLYVVEKDETLVGRLYAVPLLGARPHAPLLVDLDGPISFSPAGDRFTYVQYKSAGEGTISRLMVSNADGRASRQLLVTSDVFLFRHPVWSPDGRRVAVFAFKERAQSSGQAFLYLVNLDGSEWHRLLPDWQSIGQPRWTPDNKSLIVGGVLTFSEPGRRFQLHQLDVNTGADRKLTDDLAAYREVSLSADAREMTAIKADAKGIVWISRPNDYTHGYSAPAEVERTPALAWADGEHLIVNSRRNGFPNLGLLDVQTRSFAALTDEQFVEQGAVTIPGVKGRSVVFASNRSGHFHLWRFDAEENRLRQLTFGPNYDDDPTVTPDGRWVLYTSWGQNVPQIRKVPSEGGASEQIGQYRAQHPQVSSDGKNIACYLQNAADAKWTVAIVPFSGNGEARSVKGVSTPMVWSPDGKSLTTAITDTHGVSNVWRVPLDGGAASPLTDFEDQSIVALAWSPGGDRIACLRATIGADVALFKTARQQALW
jgi:Tol biopolymer transport system component